MSTEQPLDPSLIEQTKQQIRSLYAEIAQLARSDIAPEEFYAEMLPRVISALAAVGGVVWAKQDQGQIGLQYQINLQESRLAEQSEEDQMRHGRLLQKVLTTGEGLLVPPHSGAGDSDQAANTTDWLLVLGPLKTELEVVGVVEVFQRAEAGAAIQRGYLRFLLEVCALASEFLNSRQLRHFSDRQSLWTQLEEFTRLVHGSLNPRDTAYTIANEGRRLIECDRVSVAIRKGERCTIEAVSGQDMVDKRSNTVRLLGRLATVVVASEEPMWYSGDTRDMAPQVEDAVQEYVDESHTKMIAVLPLKRAQLVEKDKERPDDPDDSPRPIGALIVEQIEDSRISQKMLSRVDVVAQHSSAALVNALEHENIFLMPVWRTLGKSRWVVQGRNLPKVLLGLIAAVVLIVAMAVVPWDFRLHAKGSLEPVNRHDVFAAVDADRVVDVKVEHADAVAKSQLLAVLRNNKLSEELTQLAGQIATTRDQLEQATRQLTWDWRKLSAEDKARLNGEIMTARAKLESLLLQRRNYAEQEKELQVKSPCDGVIVTWDVHNRLIDRPVQRGQVLMRVADPNGPWQLELHMSDDRMGHIVRELNKTRAKVRDRLRVVLGDQMRDQVRQKLRSELAAGSKTDAVSPANSGARLASSSTTVVATSQELASNDKASTDPASQTSATPAGADSAAPSQPGGVAESDLDRQVEQQLPSRLEKEVNTVLAGVRDDQLAAKLLEVSGEKMEDRLKVPYIVATDPSTTHYGYVKDMHLVAEVRGEEGNTVMIKVEINKEDLKEEDRRPGASVTAKVECGRRAIGYCWFHDLLAFFRKTWFRWF